MGKLHVANIERGEEFWNRRKVRGSHLLVVLASVFEFWRTKQRRRGAMLSLNVESAGRFYTRRISSTILSTVEGVPSQREK